MNREGEIKYNKQGEKMTVINYRKYEDIDIYHYFNDAVAEKAPILKENIKNDKRNHFHLAIDYVMEDVDGLIKYNACFTGAHNLDEVGVIFVITDIVERFGFTLDQFIEYLTIIKNFS